MLFSCEKNKGFTLIELLVVISIISLLSSVVLASLSSAREKARIAAGQTFAGSLYHAYGSNARAIYNFNEGSSNSSQDESGNNAVLTFNGNPAWVTGVNGKGVYFADNSQYATSSGMGLGTDWTMATWVKFSNVSARHHIFLSFGLPYFTLVSKKFMISWSSPTSVPPQQTLYDTTIRDIGKWYFVAATHSDINKKTILYVDGKMIDVRENTTSAPVGNGAPLYVGNHSSRTYSCMCSLDESRIYNETLSTAQIEKLYANEVSIYNLTLK